MENTGKKTACFVWGQPSQTGGLSSAGEPSFRLTHPAGAFPPVRVPLFAPAGARPVVRGGRTVAWTWEDADAVFCLMAGVLPPDVSAPRGTQAEAVFPEMESVLAEAGMTFANVVRTWMYIDRVCEWYGEFNAARSAFFEKRNVFETFLPASTGIGSANLDGAALTVGAIAMAPKTAAARAEIVDSPLQEPAMAYKSSFSRAAEIVLPSRRQLFISGTASIMPGSHEVAHVDDPARQIECTMSAVKAILESRGYGWSDVCRAIAYLKKPGFLEPWRAWLAANSLPADFAAETVCDVCRDEWLFEIELDAARGGRIV